MACRSWQPGPVGPPRVRLRRTQAHPLGDALMREFLPLGETPIRRYTPGLFVLCSVLAACPVRCQRCFFLPKVCPALRFSFPCWFEREANGKVEAIWPFVGSDSYKTSHIEPPIWIRIHSQPSEGWMAFPTGSCRCWRASVPSFAPIASGMSSSTILG